MFVLPPASTLLRRLRNRKVTLPEAQRLNDILPNIERYDLWVVPEFPMDRPWVRARDGSDSWRVRLLDNIRDEGLRYPLCVYGHSPKGPIIDKYRCEWNADRDDSMYVFIGTNRFWCLEELGYTTFPAVFSLNKGEVPEWDAYKILPDEFPQYAPDDCYRIWVREHAFGYKPLVMAEDAY